MVFFLHTYSMLIISTPSMTFFFLVLFVSGPGNEPGTSDIQGKCSTTELRPQPYLSAFSCSFICLAFLIARPLGAHDNRACAVNHTVWIACRHPSYSVWNPEKKYDCILDFNIKYDYPCVLSIKLWTIQPEVKSRTRECFYGM